MAPEGRRRRPLSLSSAILLLSVSNPTTRGVLADASTKPAVSDSKCDCFVTNGSDVAYFSHHKFFDLRSLQQYQGTPGLLSDNDLTTNAPSTSAYFTSDSFASFWQAQNWNNNGSAATSNATVLRINSLNNIFIEKNTDASPSSATWLTLRTARQGSFQSTAEIVTQNDTYQHISMRMLARTVGSPGACTAMFTYRAPPDPAASTSRSSVNGRGSANNKDNNGEAQLQEVDLEVLTKYPRSNVQCTNQPAIDEAGQPIDGVTQNATLPGGLGWDDWVVYRLDWTPRQSTWYVGGEQIASITKQVPQDPARIHINAWSDGSAWTGTMAPNTEAHLQIQWWELLYNATASTTGRKSSCASVCSIDVDGTAGQAVLVVGSAASGRIRPANLGCVGWFPFLLIAFMFCKSLR